MLKLVAIGIYPGTFDPITLGHLDIIRRSLNVVDKLIVAIAKDVDKETIFSLEERAQMIKHELRALKSNIEVEYFEGLLISFAKKKKVSIIIRGLRAISDFDYEFQMSWINYKLNSKIETIFLPASEDTQFVSSSFIKQIAKLKGDISSFVPNNVAKKINDIYNIDKQ